MVQSSDQLDPATDAHPLNWSVLLIQYAQWLRSIVALRLGSSEGVEDVMQEVALAAIRQHSPIVDKSKVAPWLYRLAVVQSLLYRRMHGRHRKLIDRYVQRLPILDHDARAFEPLFLLLKDECRRQVREAVNRLAPRDVEILHLKYIDGLSHRQLGTRLKITYSAVDSRLNRARARFRNEFTAIDKPLSELTRIGQPFLSVPRSFAKC